MDIKKSLRIYTELRRIIPGFDFLEWLNKIRCESPIVLIDSEGKVKICFGSVEELFNYYVSHGNKKGPDKSLRIFSWQPISEKFEEILFNAEAFYHSIYNNHKYMAIYRSNKSLTWTKS